MWPFRPATNMKHFRIFRAVFTSRNYWLIRCQPRKLTEFGLLTEFEAACRYRRGCAYRHSHTANIFVGGIIEVLDVTESDLHHFTMLFTYFPLHVQDICFPRCFVVNMCRGSVMFMVPLFSFYAGGQFPLGKKDSGVDADFCYFVVERDFHTGQALRRWPHQVCEGTTEYYLG